MAFRSFNRTATFFCVDGIEWTLSSSGDFFAFDVDEGIESLRHNCLLHETHDFKAVLVFSNNLAHVLVKLHCVR